MIIVGLGNPGAQYARTRHNAGFLVVESALRRWGGGRWRRQGRAMAASASVGRTRHSLVRPMSFMNLSGEAVADLARQGAPAGDFLIVLDDMDLALGRLRLRPSGGAGGHKGLRSVLEALAPDPVARLRIGVGRPPSGSDAVDHVLDAFSFEEWGRMEQMIERAVDALELVVTRGLTAAMDQYNGWAAPWEEQDEGAGPSTR